MYNPEARVTVINVASDDGYQPFMLCGQQLPYPVYSVGNSIQVIFTSLSSQYPGFNATYTAITYSSGTWYTLFFKTSMIELRLRKKKENDHQQLALWKVIQESLGFCIPRFGFWVPSTGFRMSVTLRFRILIISRISDSLSRIKYSKSQDSTFHKQIVKKGYENILISVLMIYRLELKKNDSVLFNEIRMWRCYFRKWYTSHFGMNYELGVLNILPRRSYYPPLIL